MWIYHYKSTTFSFCYNFKHIQHIKKIIIILVFSLFFFFFHAYIENFRLKRSFLISIWSFSIFFYTIKFGEFFFKLHYLFQLHKLYKLWSKKITNTYYLTETKDCSNLNYFNRLTAEERYCTLLTLPNFFCYKCLLPILFTKLIKTNLCK